jgi:hypothetical protein
MSTPPVPPPPRPLAPCSFVASPFFVLPSSSAAVTNFFPSVVGTLGYSRNITYCLTAPPYLLCIAVILLNGLHSDKTQERYLHIVCPLFVTLIANIIAVSTLNTAGRYVAMMLMPGSFYASSIVTL